MRCSEVDLVLTQIGFILACHEREVFSTNSTGTHCSRQEITADPSVLLQADQPPPPPRPTSEQVQPRLSDTWTAGGKSHIQIGTPMWQRAAVGAGSDLGGGGSPRSMLRAALAAHSTSFGSSTNTSFGCAIGSDSTCSSAGGSGAHPAAGGTGAHAAGGTIASAAVAVGLDAKAVSASVDADAEAVKAAAAVAMATAARALSLEEWALVAAASGDVVTHVDGRCGGAACGERCSGVDSERQGQYNGAATFRPETSSFMLAGLRPGAGEQQLPALQLLQQYSQHEHQDEEQRHLQHHYEQQQQHPRRVEVGTHDVADASAPSTAPPIRLDASGCDASISSTAAGGMARKANSNAAAAMVGVSLEDEVAAGRLLLRTLSRVASGGSAGGAGGGSGGPTIAAAEDAVLSDDNVMAVLRVLGLAPVGSGRRVQP